MTKQNLYVHCTIHISCDFNLIFFSLFSILFCCRCTTYGCHSMFAFFFSLSRSRTNDSLLSKTCFCAHITHKYGEWDRQWETEREREKRNEDLRWTETKCNVQCTELITGESESTAFCSPSAEMKIKKSDGENRCFCVAVETKENFTEWQERWNK